MKRIDAAVGLGALRAAHPPTAVTSRTDLATAVRYTLQELAAKAPGQSVEVRVPPFGAVQILEGTTHRRGTPPAVVETDAATWLALAIGDLSWDEAVASGRVQASGERTHLAGLLPVIEP